MCTPMAEQSTSWWWTLKAEAKLREITIGDFDAPTEHTLVLYITGKTFFYKQVVSLYILWSHCSKSMPIVTLPMLFLKIALKRFGLKGYWNTTYITGIVYNLIKQAFNNLVLVNVWH
jgi:hypothetical protein